MAGTILVSIIALLYVSSWWVSDYFRGQRARVGVIGSERERRAHRWARNHRSLRKTRAMIVLSAMAARFGSDRC